MFHLVVLFMAMHMHFKLVQKGFLSSDSQYK